MSQPPEPPPRNVLPELIIPALAMLFALYYLTTIREVPWIAQASAMLVSFLLLLSIIALAIRTTFRIRSGTEYLGFSDCIRELCAQGSINLKRAILLVLAVLYVVFLPALGFSLATFLLIFSGIVLLSHGRKPFSVSGGALVQAFIIAIVCTTIGYIAFIHLFKTRFPFGLIENLIKGWLQ